MMSAGRALIGGSHGQMHRTPFAFEIHVHSSGSGGKGKKVLTVCADSHKQRRSFIRTLQNALVTRAEVERMRHRLAPDIVRAVHSQMGRKRRSAVTVKITDTMGATAATASRASLGVPMYSGQVATGARLRTKSAGSSGTKSSSSGELGHSA
jgi:hypothetical protein